MNRRAAWFLRRCKVKPFQWQPSAAASAMPALGLTALAPAAMPPISLMGDYEFPRTAGFALKKNEPGFLDFVNQTPLKLEASGEAAKIYDAWFAPVPRTFHIQPD